VRKNMLDALIRSIGQVATTSVAGVVISRRDPEEGVGGANVARA
jgi:hypothetical protein